MKKVLLFENILRENDANTLESTVKSMTGHSISEIETEFDCTILAIHRNRKEKYVIFVDDHDDGASCLYASDIESMNKGFLYAVVRHSNEKMCDAVNSGKVDGIYCDLGYPGYPTPTVHFYSFSQDCPVKNDKSDYYDFELWTGLHQKDIDHLKKNIEDFNKEAGDEICEIIEIDSFGDGEGYEKPTEIDIDSFKDNFGCWLVESDDEL